MRVMLHCGWRKGTTFHSMAWQKNKMNRGNDLSVSGATYKHQKIEVERDDYGTLKNWCPRRRGRNPGVNARRWRESGVNARRWRESGVNAQNRRGRRRSRDSWRARTLTCTDVN
eukprot:scaffold5626_cov214-Skeletonema_menzelii.AAC.2